MTIPCNQFEPTFNIGANNPSKTEGVALGNKQHPATMPRLVREEQGDTFSSTATKPSTGSATVPTLMGAGAGLGIVGGGALALLPEKLPSKLTLKEGVQGATINEANNTVTHNGFTYQFEKLDSGNLAFKNVSKPQLSPELADWKYTHRVVKSPYASIVLRPISSGSVEDEKMIQSFLALNTRPGSSDIEDTVFSVFVDETGVHVEFKDRRDGEILSFLVEKGSDGKTCFKESEELKLVIKANIFPGIEQDHIDNLKTVLEDPKSKVLDAFDALKTMKPPEAIENLVHTTNGKAWSIIGGFATVGLLLGAGIGYLLGKPKEQPAH